MNNADNLHVIVGLGISGLSCVRYLHQFNIPVAVNDTRDNPPHLEALKKINPNIPISLGKLDGELLQQAKVIVFSPGLSLNIPELKKAASRGVPIIGDIELFARCANAPIIAITGTNAKSTVTTLVAKMAEAAGLKTAVGGNLGVPALDLLNADVDLYVLELSSFQLETTYSLKAKVATVLNITPDHLDRYRDFKAYQEAKLRIYQNCETAVCNLDDPMTECFYDIPKIYFTRDQPKQNQFGLINNQGDTFLGYEKELLLNCKELPVAGKHYQANALAALAIGHAFGLACTPMLKVLREFRGLPHRCQLVREINNVKWYNDSKGTNVGASLAAIEGLGSTISGKLILIAGGLGKNADFTPLVPCIEKYSRCVVLIGEAAKQLAEVIGNRIPISFAASMHEAVRQAALAAHANDSVLLSPACASYDMFKNFEHRGEVFMEIVNSLKEKYCVA